MSKSNTLSLADALTTVKVLPNRIAVHAVEGWGKTSLAAQVPGVFFIQTKGETGLETLIGANQLPGVPHWPAFQSWKDLNSGIDELLTADHEYKALACDTVNGAADLLKEHVCETEFGGDWGEKGFSAFGRGFKIVDNMWPEFLAKLERLRVERDMGILLLAHSKVARYTNPTGPDYDRYTVAMRDQLWQPTFGWADMALFGNFETVVAGGSDGSDGRQPSKGKGSGGDIRMIYTTRCAAYDAKHRHGLPREIEAGNSPQEAWNNFRAALAAGRKKAA